MADALADSPFCVLDQRDQLRLVSDLVSAEEDALCVALVCRRFRDAIFARFPWRLGSGRQSRLRTSVVGGMTASISRFAWARSLPSHGCVWLGTWGGEVCQRNKREIQHAVTLKRSFCSPSPTPSKSPSTSLVPFYNPLLHGQRREGIPLCDNGRSVDAPLCHGEGSE